MTLPPSPGASAPLGGRDILHGRSVAGEETSLHRDPRSHGLQAKCYRCGQRQGREARRDGPLGPEARVDHTPEGPLLEDRLLGRLVALRVALRQGEGLNHTGSSGKEEFQGGPEGVHTARRAAVPSRATRAPCPLAPKPRGLCGDRGSRRRHSRGVPPPLPFALRPSEAIAVHN